jgi:hypothetical protein
VRRGGMTGPGKTRRLHERAGRSGQGGTCVDGAALRRTRTGCHVGFGTRGYWIRKIALVGPAHIEPASTDSGLPSIILSIMAPPVLKNRHTNTTPTMMKTILRYVV